MFTGSKFSSKYLRKDIRPDRTVEMKYLPLIKVLSILRQKSYGIPIDLSENLFALSKNISSSFLKAFCVAVKASLEPFYLCEPKGTSRIQRRKGGKSTPIDMGRSLTYEIDLYSSVY